MIERNLTNVVGDYQSSTRSPRSHVKFRPTSLRSSSTVKVRRNHGGREAGKNLRCGPERANQAINGDGGYVANSSRQPLKHTIFEGTTAAGSSEEILRYPNGEWCLKGARDNVL
jgi:hypothetical protein